MKVGFLPTSFAPAGATSGAVLIFEPTGGDVRVRVQSSPRGSNSRGC